MGAQARSEVGVGATLWYRLIPLQVDSNVQTRFEVAVGATVWYLARPSQMAKFAQTRLLDTVGAETWYCEAVQTEIATHDVALA